MSPLAWLNPGRWLLVAAFIAALLLGVWRLDVSRQAIGYNKAKAEYAKQVKDTDGMREAVAAPIAAKQEAAQAQIRTITKTLIEKVPVYVKADACALPPGFRLLHDAAAANVEVSDAASVLDDSPIAAQAVAGTTVENYGIYHETAERLRGLQEWVSAQQALK